MDSEYTFDINNEDDWYSIDKVKPTEGEYVLAYCKIRDERFMWVIRYHEPEGLSHAPGHVTKGTHWKYLPLPPKD